MVVVGCRVTGIPFMASASPGSHSAWSHLQKSRVLRNRETVWFEYVIRRGAYEFDKHPQLSIHSHYCDCDMKFSFWDWRVICEVERATWVKPHKGPRRIWEIEHDLLSTDLGRNRVGEDVRGNMSYFPGMEKMLYKIYFLSRSAWTLLIVHFTFTEPKVIIWSNAQMLLLTSYLVSCCGHYQCGQINIARIANAVQVTIWL